VLTYTA